MATTTRDEVVRFAADVTGTASLDDFATKIDELGKASDASAPAAKALFDELT